MLVKGGFKGGGGGLTISVFVPGGGLTISVEDDGDGGGSDDGGGSVVVASVASAGKGYIARAGGRWSKRGR